MRGDKEIKSHKKDKDKLEADNRYCDIHKLINKYKNKGNENGKD